MTICCHYSMVTIIWS